MTRFRWAGAAEYRIFSVCYDLSCSFTRMSLFLSKRVFWSINACGR